MQERIRTELERLAEPHQDEHGLEVPVSIRIASAARPFRAIGDGLGTVKDD
jgi:hypothetical protein